VLVEDTVDVELPVCEVDEVLVLVARVTVVWVNVASVVVVYVGTSVQ